MPSPPPTLTAIVCCYSLERWPLLVRCVQSLLDQMKPVDEVIVVVDHNDALRKRVSESFKRVQVIENRYDQGLSGARDSGVERATSEVVAFIDDDAECAPDWSQRILGAYVDDSILGVGGQVIPRFEDARPRWLPREFDWVIGCTYVGHRASRGVIRNPIGANMSIRRSVFAKVGRFHGDLGRTGGDAAGCEETELCIRASTVLGGVFWYEPEAVVTHFVPKSRATRQYFRRRCLDEGTSKATIARLAGRSRGLASERRYLTHTVPLAAFREAVHALLLRPGAASRCAALISGVVLTVLGYARGLLRQSRKAPSDAYAPIHITRVDIDAPADIAPGLSRSGEPYGQARVLVESHSSPVAILPVSLNGGRVSASELHTLMAPLRRAHSEDPVDIAQARGKSPREWPFVSVVVATRDRPESLETALASLLDLSYDRFEIVVVDNGSTTTSTRELVERVHAEDERVRYVFEARPGLARAHNRGLQVARGEIIAFTDDDVVVDPLWLRALVDGFDTDERVACVTGLILPSELETQAQWWTESFFGLSKGLRTRRYDLGRFRPSDPLFPFAAGRLGSGANMAFRADRLRALGGFVPSLGTGTPARGADDLAAFFDVLVSGDALVYEPRAVVHHQHRESYSALKRQAFGYGVGLGAYLTHVAVSYPRLLGRATRLLPRAVRYVLAEESPKNSGRDASTPRELKRLERLGLVSGPYFYLRSRLATRDDRWDFERHVPEPRLDAATTAGD